jgi:hypothetical protein
MERNAALGAVCHVGVMSDHDDCGSLPMQFFKKGHDFVAGVAIEGAGRLIGQDQQCLIHERPSDGDALLLASRQLARPMVFAMKR